MKEIWKIVEDAPNYEVSNLGNVRHINKKVNRIPQDNGNGYKHIAYVAENGKRRNFYVHIAVAKAFVPNPDPEHYTQVSHLDESRDNNCADNLVWASPKENCNMPLHLERMGIGRGLLCKCIETGVIYYSAREAARQMGLQQSAISKCCRGKQKTSGGFHFEYVEG